MLEDFAETIAEIEGLNISPAKSGLGNLLANARFRFTEVLCQLWKADADILPKLEDWTLDPVDPSNTLFINDIVLFHKSNARLAYLVAGGKDSLPGTTRPKDSLVKPEFVARIKASFMDALKTSLEGMVQIAFNTYEPLEPGFETGSKAVTGSNLTIDVTQLVSILRPLKRIISAEQTYVDPQDTRLLLTVTSILQLNQNLLPSLLKQFGEAYQLSLKDETKQLKDLCQRIDHILFDDYVIRKGDDICRILKDGILGVDWQNLPKPTDVHPFIYEALLALVQIHAQVRAVAKQLVDRVIVALLEKVTNQTLKNFRKVEVFGMGGMLQATLEVEFMHQTLAQFVSPAAEKTLKQVYETISERYRRKSSEENELLKQELETVKKTLVTSRKATALQFLCFRRTRTKEREKEKEESSPSKSRS